MSAFAFTYFEVSAAEGLEKEAFAEVFGRFYAAQALKHPNLARYVHMQSLGEHRAVVLSEHAGLTLDAYLSART